jgi:hypothetical protein
VPSTSSRFEKVPVDGAELLAVVQHEPRRRRGDASGNMSENSPSSSDVDGPIVSIAVDAVHCLHDPIGAQHASTQPAESSQQ